jgi:membrane fusion protein (multidrug efflux system)
MKLYITIVCLFLFSCIDTKPERDSPSTMIEETGSNTVAVMVLKKETFKKEIVSNGKLKALRKSDLRFSISGKLSDRVVIRNGQRVLKDQALAHLDDGEFKRSVEKSKTTFKIAELELEDFLLSRELSLKDTAKMPKEALSIAKIRSGYTMAKQDLNSSEYALQNTILKAPFSGKIANVRTNPYEQVSAAEVFCTLIDDMRFEVEFYLVESEIGEIKLNDKVRIMPNLTTTPLYGFISQINPLVDEHGLIMVKARIENTTGSLLEGMNVKIFIEKNVDGLLVVPKSAIVLRQNQEVLFKYSQGQALWTYVQKTLENSESYSVIPHPDKGSTLNPGDTVIITGNLNLAHESRVQIR